MKTYEEFIAEVLNKRGRYLLTEDYKEKHHIQPRCCGGSDEESNLIDLLAEEHYEAHRLLAIENPDNYHLQYAWTMMAFTRKGLKVVSADDYAKARKECARLNRGRKFSEDFKEKCRKAKIGNKNALGHTLTEESKQKIQLTKLKNGTNKWSEEYRRDRKENPRHWKLSDETKRKMSESKKGVKFSDEHKKKLSEWQKGQPKPSSRYKRTPEHIAKIRESRIKSGKTEPGNKGKICINDGRKVKYIGINESIPDGWVKGNISYLWFNDGIYSYKVNPLDEYKYIGKFIRGKNKLPRKIEVPDMEEAESIENNVEELE